MDGTCNLIMLHAHNGGIKHLALTLQRVHCREYTLLKKIPIQGNAGIEMGECCSDRRFRIVICWNINSLNRGYCSCQRGRNLFLQFARLRSRKSTPDALSKRDSFIIRITHPTHPLRGQTFVVQPLFGGRPDPNQLLIALPNGERRLIPQAWTDQVTHIDYPPGACFVAERLLLVRQRLDALLVQAGEQTILMARD